MKQIGVSFWDAGGLPCLSEQTFGVPFLIPVSADRRTPFVCGNSGKTRDEMFVGMSEIAGICLKRYDERAREAAAK